jgi:hypothetical protein
VTHKGLESARAKLFLKKQEPLTIYYLPTFTFTQKKQNKNAVHPGIKKIAVHTKAACRTNCMQNKISTRRTNHWEEGDTTTTTTSTTMALPWEEWKNNNQLRNGVGDDCKRRCKVQ